MRVQIQTLTLIPWKGFILIFTSFLTLNELERICTLLRVLITKHTTTPQHIPWDIEPAHPGHPWNCHTYPTVPSLMYSYFSNVSFPSNGNAYVIHAKVPGLSRSQTRIYKEQVNKTKEHWGRRHVSRHTIPIFSQILPRLHWSSCSLLYQSPSTAVTNAGSSTLEHQISVLIQFGVHKSETLWIKAEAKVPTGLHPFWMF